MCSYTNLAFLSGFAAKAYDDLSDNPKLHKFKTDFIMEYLKGLHYISFTALSVEEPLFFYVYIIANLLHSMTNPEGFKDPYEHSLLYSFLLLFLVLYGRPISSVMMNDWLIILVVLIGFFAEPLFAARLPNSETSFYKMIYRLGWGLVGAGILWRVSLCSSAKYILSYLVGYCILSAVVQYYSVFVPNAKVDADSLDNNELPTLTKDEEISHTPSIDALPLDTLPLDTLQPDPDLQHNILSSPAV